MYRTIHTDDIRFIADSLEKLNLSLQDDPVIISYHSPLISFIENLVEILDEVVREDKFNTEEQP